jgi:hypothetical protein
MNNTPHLDPELLSAYLDDEVTAAERTQVEAHLASCQQCHTDLEGLRWTVGLMAQLPLVELPRAFYLTEAAVSPTSPARQWPGWLQPLLSFSTALSALAFLVLLLTTITPLGGTETASAPRPQAGGAAAVEKLNTSSAEQPAESAAAAPTAAVTAQANTAASVGEEGIAPLAEPAAPPAAAPSGASAPTATSEQRSADAIAPGIPVLPDAAGSSGSDGFVSGSPTAQTTPSLPDTAASGGAAPPAPELEPTSPPMTEREGPAATAPSQPTASPALAATAAADTSAKATSADQTANEAPSLALEDDQRQDNDQALERTELITPLDQPPAAWPSRGTLLVVFAVLTIVLGGSTLWLRRQS